jgi:hypothetical protein
MKIYFERIGGFAGLKLALTLDLDDLAADDAEALQKMVQDASFFHRPEPDKAPGISDGFQYTLTVEQDADQRTLQVSEGALPEELRLLMNDLSIRARSRKR